MGEILRRRPDHRRAADIDILHRLGQLHPGPGNGPGKGIEVDHQQGDRNDPLLLQLLTMFRQLQPGQQAAVDQRMQRLHPPPQNLWKTGHRGRFGHGDAPLDQSSGGPPGRDNLPAEPLQLPSQLDDPLLVGDAEQRSLFQRIFILFQ